MAYFPNSCAGEIFDSQCQECFHGRNQDVMCPVSAVQTMWNYDQLKPGNEELREAMAILVNDKGECQVFALMKRLEGKVNDKAACLQRPLVFGDHEQIAALK